jgi:hypothetical protein
VKRLYRLLGSRRPYLQLNYRVCGPIAWSRLASGVLNSITSKEPPEVFASVQRLLGFPYIWFKAGVEVYICTFSQQLPEEEYYHTATHVQILPDTRDLNEHLPFHQSDLQACGSNLTK